MSVHSCNELCEIDDRFHDIQKHEGEYESWSSDKAEMVNFLFKRIERNQELIRLLIK